MQNLSDMTPLQAAGCLWLAWMAVWIGSSFFTLRKKQNEIFRRLQHTVPTAAAVLLIFHGRDAEALDWGRAIAYEPLRWAGVAVTGAGQAFAIWARWHLGRYWSGTVALKHGHRIVDTGPYAHLRHPIYTGLLSAMLGSAVAAGTVEAFAGFLILLPAYYWKSLREEKLMLEEFGAEYRAYMRRTRMILPWPKSWKFSA